MGVSETHRLKGLPAYMTPALSREGAWGVSGGVAMRDSIQHGSANGVMSLLKGMDAGGMVIALRESGFTVPEGQKKHGRNAVFGSVKTALETAIGSRADGFTMRSQGAHGDLKPTFAAKEKTVDFSAKDAPNFQGDIAAALQIQALFRSDVVRVDLLGESSLRARPSLLLIAGQAMEKKVQGFGFDGLPGKFQVPLSMDEMVELHREAAQSVAVQSARSGLDAWANGNKVTALSEWVPDNVQRMLHGPMSLAAANQLVREVQGGSVAKYAAEIGQHSITQLLGDQGLDVNAATVYEMAEDLSLAIKEPNRDRGQYFGSVVGEDHRAVLIRVTRTEAIALPFSAFPGSEQKPKLGESLRLGYRDGVLTTGRTNQVGREAVSR